MAKELKKYIVEDFQQRLADMSGCVLIDYHGLNAEQTTELRTELRKNGVRMNVLQNRLARHALSGRDDLPEEFRDLLVGPTALLFAVEDGALTASKILARWQKKNKGLAKAKGGLYEGKVLSMADVGELAKIPDRETLQAQVAGLFGSPLQSLASAAKSVISNLAGCAKSRQEELES